MLTGLDVRYDLPGAHPLTGSFLPGPAPAGVGAARPAAGLCAGGRPVLLDLADDPRVRAAAAGHAGRVDVVTAPPAAAAPEAAAAGGPAALLVRPDGYVAWAGDDGPAGLAEALALWCGAPVADHDRVPAA
jgi:bifunctional hydroxylase/dehydrase